MWCMQQKAPNKNRLMLFALQRTYIKYWTSIGMTSDKRTVAGMKLLIILHRVFTNLRNIWKCMLSNNTAFSVLKTYVDKHIYELLTSKPGGLRFDWMVFLRFHFLFLSPFFFYLSVAFHVRSNYGRILPVMKHIFSVYFLRLCCNLHSFTLHFKCLTCYIPTYSINVVLSMIHESIESWALSWLITFADS